jgi:tRNA nucleotidyltransferase/poly(A) polymerase
MIPNNIKDIMQQLLNNGKEAFIIGGAVRDKLMSIEPHDYDIFTNATGEEILTIFPQGKVIGGEIRQAKILTVIVDGVEVSQYRSNGDRTETGKSLKEHVLTCDFTINAMAMDCEENIIDYVGGRQDINSKILPFVGSACERVEEDPLRVYRGIRFAAKYNLTMATAMDNDCAAFIYNNFISVNTYHIDIPERLPKERIREELLKIIQIPNGLQLLDKYNMLGYIIPEWENCKGLDGGPHHNETLDEHMFIALDTARQYTNNPLLLLGVFLHDIGKPLSVGVKEDSGLTTFYNHHTIGSNYVKVWMREYKFSEDDIKYITVLIIQHMMGKTGLLSQRTFASICNDLVNAKITPEDMLVVTFSDNQANRLNPRLKYNDFITNNGFLQRYYEAKYGRFGFNPNDLEINGKDIINIMEISGPAIGVVKKELFDMVCDGTIINRRDRLIEELRNRKINIAR